jgi:hypothetical protein
VLLGGLLLGDGERVEAVGLPRQWAAGAVHQRAVEVQQRRDEVGIGSDRVARCGIRRDGVAFTSGLPHGGKPGQPAERGPVGPGE